MTATKAPKTTTKNADATEQRKVNKIAAGSVKKDEIMALVWYVKVKANIASGEALAVANLDDNGNEFRINGRQLVENCLSADQFAEEIKVGKTEAAKILTESHNRPLTVSFQKQDGSERVLRGRLVAAEPLLGRSHVEDLDLPLDDKNKLRLVDHRTINYLVVDGVKYTVK